MLLADYLKRNRVSKAEFARSIGKSQDIVFRWLRGYCYPQRATANKIVEVTKGKVRIEDIYK